MSGAMTLAVTWNPFLRGIIVVLIAVAVLCGSTYFLLLTNLGARLGFLVAMAGLFGWLALMSAVWVIYGIGLKGKDPTWQPVAVINQPEALATNPIIGGDGFLQSTETQKVDGWRLLAEDDPERGQAVAASDDIIVNQAQIFKAGEYLTVAVFDKGGARYPIFGDFDFFAFFHRPHYALVQVQPVIKQNTEPGKAPPTPQADPTQPPRFVLMERDLGNRRRPAAFIFLGSTLIFLYLCWVLHRREKLVAANRSATADTGEELERVGSGV
jgi:hypothetical protein